MIRAGRGLTIVRALFADVRSELGRQIVTAALLMAGGALAEGVGLLTIIPLLALAAGKGAGITQGFARRAPGTDLFLPAVALFVAAMIARAVILLARDRATARVESDYEASLRSRAAATLAARGWPFASTVGQPGMQTLLANDVPRASIAVHYGLSALTAAFILLVQLGIAAALSLPMALGALALLALGLPWLDGMARRSGASGLAIVDSQDEATQAAYIFHAGLKAALAQGTTADFVAAYRASLARLAAQLTRYSSDMARGRARHAIAASIGAAAVVATGHYLALGLPRLLGLLILFARMSGPAQSLQQALVGVTAYAPSFGAIVGRLGPLSGRTTDDGAGRVPLPWTRLELRQAGIFRDNRSGLAPVDLTLARGEWVAVVGPSGAGKTTLLDLVSGLIAPDTGALMVDGAPLVPERRASWQAGLAYVGQQEMPFDRNIGAALGEVDDNAKWAVLDLVSLADLVRLEPFGLETPIADRGARLSGGERQRLLIARALLRRPTLLLLDEATAALDVAGERTLVERVRAAHPHLAVLLVAHRAESTALCDRVVSISRSA